MKNLRNVLVGVDFTQASDNALREAARIARWDGAKLTALHVLDEAVARDLGEHAPQLKTEVLAEADGRLHAHVNEILGSSQDVRARFVVGNPFGVIAGAVKEHQADLLVLGSHGRGHPEARAVGSVASKCIRLVSANVLLLREHQRGPFRRIVGCVDFSSHAAEAAAQAVHIARQDRAQLEFLLVYEPLKDRLAHSNLLLAAGLDEESLRAERIEKKWKASLAEFVEPIVAESGGHPFELKVLVCLDTRSAIIDHLNESSADLVVLGTRGRTSLRNLLLGSTAERIIHHASCSALAIKPSGFQYDLT